MKFTNLGGGITIKAYQEGKNLQVAITDTGAGILPEHLDKIFDRFFHFAAVNIDSQEGSGLGLSIAQSIAKIHHGEITVKSQPQKGATFIVTLPL